MPQLTYENDLAPAQEGQLADSGVADIVSRTVGANVAQLSTLLFTNVVAAVAQVDTWTLTNAADGDNHSVTVNGVEVTHLSVGTGDTVTRDAFLVIMLADDAFTAIVTPAASSTDAITLTAVDPAVSLNVVATVEATSTITLTTTTPQVLGGVTLTINGVGVSYNTASTTIEDERDAFLAILQADPTLSGVVTFAASSTDSITVTADVAGTPFTSSLAVTGANAAALTATTANVTANPIPFGRALARGSEKKVTLPSATGFKMDGISKLDHSIPNPNQDPDAVLNATGEPVFDETTPVPTVKRGRIYVSPEDDVNDLINQQVYVRHTAEIGFTDLGRFTPTAGGNVDLVPEAEWESEAAADGLCVVSINLP